MSLEISNGLTITGAWTKAGCASCVQVTSSRGGKLNMLFDCGVAESQTLSAKQVFISHGHVDHVGAAIIHARSKSLSKAVAEYYVPAEIASSLHSALMAFEQMEGKEIPMRIIAVTVGDEIELSNEVSVKVIRTMHRVPSVGYAVCFNKQGLLPQYRNLPPQEISSLKKSGVVLRGPIEQSVELVYTGDTVIDMFLLPENQFLLSAKTLITEMTYLDGEYRKARDYGHIHIDDFINHVDLFAKVKNLVFVHLSAKYSPYSRAVSILRSKLPPELLCKTLVSLQSFGANEVLTLLSSVSEEEQQRQVGWGWGNRSSSQPFRKKYTVDREQRRSVSSYSVEADSYVDGGREERSASSASWRRRPEPLEEPAIPIDDAAVETTDSS